MVIAVMIAPERVVHPPGEPPASIDRSRTRSMPDVQILPADRASAAL